MTSAAPLVFDRALLTLRRNRAARAWRPVSQADFLLERVADDLLDRLAFIKRRFPVMLNLGAHGDMLGQRLRAATDGLVVDVDPARAMLAACRSAKVCADEEVLPFKPHAIDAVVSALAFQHVNDLPGTLIQIQRILKPDGLLLATVVGGETLAELRQALVMAESEVEGGASPRVAPFADGRDLGALLQRAGFALPVVDSDRCTVSYATPLALMQDLRAMGATNVLRDRRRTALRRSTLLRACALYAERYSRPDGRILATFELITMTAWAPHASQPKPLQPGSAKARLADALGTQEIPIGDKPL